MTAMKQSENAKHKNIPFQVMPPITCLFYKVPPVSIADFGAHFISKS